MTFLNFSEAVSLAFHSLAILVSNPDMRITAREMAKLLNASEAHLSKIMQRLIREGFLLSVRGPKGGFVLAKKAEDIRLLEIFEALEGKYRLSDCLMDESLCKGKRCILGEMVGNISNIVFKTLSEHTLIEMKNPVLRLETNPCFQSDKAGNK